MSCFRFSHKCAAAAAGAMAFAAPQNARWRPIGAAGKHAQLAPPPTARAQRFRKLQPAGSLAEARRMSGITRPLIGRSAVYSGAGAPMANASLSTTAVARCAELAKSSQESRPRKRRHYDKPAPGDASARFAIGDLGQGPSGPSAETHPKNSGGRRFNSRF